MSNSENIDLNIIRYFPKYDTVFKNLFKGNKEKDILLIDLLNNILYSGNDTIIEVKYIDTNMEAKRVKNAYRVEEWDDLKPDEKDKIIKSLKSNKNESKKDFENYDSDGSIDENENDFDNEKDLVGNNKKRNNKNVDNKDKKKKLRENFFEGKTSNLDMLVEIIRENYAKDVNNKKNDDKKNLVVIRDDSVKFLALTKRKEIINIEIQVKNSDDMFKRSLFYASNVVIHSLKSGDLYKDLPKIVIINFLHYNIIENNKNKFHWCFSFHDKTTKTEEGFKDVINIHFIELKKFENIQKQSEKIENENLWYLFLVDPNNNIFLNGDTPKNFVTARKILLDLERDSNYTNIMDKETKDYQEYINGLKYREEIGIEKGEKKGKKENSFEVALAMFKENEDINKIKKYSFFSDSELTEIRNFLNIPDENNIKQLAEKLEIDPEDIIFAYNKIYN